MCHRENWMITTLSGAQHAPLITIAGDCPWRGTQPALKSVLGSLWLSRWAERFGPLESEVPPTLP